MKNQIILSLLSIFLVLFSLTFVSSLVVDSVNIGELHPGQSSALAINIKNNLQDDVEEVSFALNLDSTTFTTIGGSEDSEDEIKEGRREIFNFVLKAPSDIKPGNYNIPYTLIYTDWNNDRVTKTGSFGVTISARTELSYTIEASNNVVGEKGELSVKVINSGLGDIGFVYVRIISANGFEILSANEEYVGNVGSDDFELATFNVLYTGTTASLTAQIEYKDFGNQEETKTISLPVKVYTREKGLELGLIKKDNTLTYGIIVAILIVAWIIYGRIKKRRKRKLRS
jgi:hypothetical protein